MIETAKSWLLFKSAPGGYAENMAWDEALLEAMPRLGRPVLRFYSWIEPAASFGYFQKHHEVERLTKLRPLVRRPTGGGIVPHVDDWTYSLSFPTGHAWYLLSAKESYLRVHDWIRASLARFSLLAQLAPSPSISGPGQCFVGHEQSDLLWHGKKIAGAAQRRRRDGLLIQGSLQPPDWSIRRLDWETAMTEVAREEYHVDWSALTPDEELCRRVQLLTAQKYCQKNYNQRR